jgi:hypothetical protein
MWHGHEVHHMMIKTSCDMNHEFLKFYSTSDRKNQFKT